MEYLFAKNNKFYQMIIIFDSEIDMKENHFGTINEHEEALKTIFID